jgi:hypothetical protein
MNHIWYASNDSFHISESGVETSAKKTAGGGSFYYGKATRLVSDFAHVGDDSRAADPQESETARYSAPGEMGCLLFLEMTSCVG